MTVEAAPVVSVVTGVYNAARYLKRSAESILAQEGVSWEWVVVDDGSTDGSSQCLADLARADPRVRVVHQANQGLTRALIRGCELARGRYIARHDADDLSLPSRLARQCQLLNSNPGLSMVSCWSTMLGPAEEPLLEIIRPPDPREATEALRAGTAGPPGHGSAMFRAEAYHRVGGYRVPFRYAQDWDLWLRLIEAGDIAYLQATLYAFRVTEDSISGQKRQEQLRLFEIARQCQEARRQGQTEAPYLEEAARVSWPGLSLGRRPSSGNTYFIGKCLLDRRDRRAIPYLWRSVRRNPWRWRHWAALAAATILCKSGPKTTFRTDG